MKLENNEKNKTKNKRNNLFQQNKISKEESNNSGNEEEKEISKFEQSLNLMDTFYKEGLLFEKDFEPDYSINYPNLQVNDIPCFTPSTRLNNALQIEDKNEFLIYYYTHKKTLYPTIYNQIMGISGPRSIFEDKEVDFIYANAKTIVFTNQKHFINLYKLINEYVNPLMESYEINEESKNFFIEKLKENIYIEEYLNYDELLVKINELNIDLMEHKINNVGLVIIDGLNSTHSQKIEFITENGKNYKLKFYKYNPPYKYEPNSNKKNKKNSVENNNILTKNAWENSSVKKNLYGYNSEKKKNKNDLNEKENFSEFFQQSIVTLILNYKEKYNFNLIITVFDYSQDNFYNLNISGRTSYKEISKNVYTVNTPELQKENCYFSFKLPKNYFPKKILFIEPINYSLNYNDNIFGLITNPSQSNKLVFIVFKKETNDYRPKRILEQIEYQYR